MSISSIQKNRKTKEFVQSLVKKGISPNSFELNNLLTEYFDNHILGMPYYSPIKQKAYEESNKSTYNHNFATLGEDMECIYEANIETNNKAVAMQEYYDLEKNKVRNAISKLSLRVENIAEAIQVSSKVKQYTQVFDDLYDIEFYGNAKRNIPYTTSFVDLMQKKIYTDKTNSKVNKIAMTDASLSIDGLNSFNLVETDGVLAKILTDTLSDIYVLSCKSSTDTEKIITIDIDLGSVIEFNMVSFSFTSTKSMLCELYLSDDNENFISVHDISNSDFIEWNFNTKAAQYLRIVCHKTEPDGLSSNIDEEVYFEYYFILKNISIAKERFENKSTFVSKLIDFDDLTSTIKLDAEDRVFNNTRIDYFIGFDNETDKIGWDAIENHQDHLLFMFEKRHKILNQHISEYGHQTGITDLYQLYKLPDNVNRNSIKVTPGYNMWSIKRYNRKDGDSNDDGFSLSSMDFSDYIDNCTMTQMFMDCDNYINFPINTNVLYVMTQYVSLESSNNLFNKFIKVTDTTWKTDMSDTEIRIFVNGYEVITTGSNNYSFALKKGVNKIQIAIYSPNRNAQINRLYHNINFKTLTNNVFGFTPMKYTTSTILDKMIGETYQYYTIKDGYLYVKCDPDELIQSDLNDMGYFVSYYSLREDMVGYFDDNHIKFRIMAIMTSNDKNVSPELLNFRITGR